MLTPYFGPLSWKEQLLAERVGRETASALGPALGESARRNDLAVSRFAREVVASNEALREAFGGRFDDLSNTLSFGFDDVVGAIGELREDLNYRLSLIREQLEIQHGQLERITEALEAISHAVRTPLQTRAQEYFQEGYRLFEQGLYDKALDYLKRGEAEYDVDFLAQYYTGIVCLYGVSEEVDVVDLLDAERHLQNAFRYARPILEGVPDARRYAAQAAFHASVACYAQAGDLRRSGAGMDRERKKLAEALVLAQNATQLLPHFAEAHYHIAKYAALLGQQDLIKPHLRRAISRDPSYLLKVDNDQDFDSVRANVQSLSLELREEVRLYLDWIRGNAKRWRGELADLLLENDAWATPEFGRQLVVTILASVAEASPVYEQRGSYLDLRLAIEELHKRIAEGEWWRSLVQTVGPSLSDHISRRMGLALLVEEADGQAQEALPDADVNRLLWEYLHL